MYIVKGFTNIKPFIDNQPGELSVIGELSTHAKTFSTEIGYYNDSTKPEIEFTSFFIRDDDTMVELDIGYKDLILNISEWLYNQAIAGSISEVTENLRLAILDEFSADIENVIVGEPIDIPDMSNVRFPTFLFFTRKGTDVDNNVQIYFSDSTFRSQYDEFEIEVVPPVPDSNIDILMGTYNEVDNALESADDRQERVETVRDNRPTTVVKVQTFLWVKPEYPEDTIETAWTVLIWGDAGNNIDAIKLAIQEHVFAITAFTTTEWEEHIPDLFEATEFIIIPFWDEIAIENTTDGATLYSPAVPVNRVLPIIKYINDRYTDIHLENETVVTNLMWKNISFAITASADNSYTLSNFRHESTDGEIGFKKYLAVPSTHVDASKMPDYIRNWIPFIVDLFMEAETMTTFSPTPSGLTRMERNGYIYIVSSYKGIQYLVLSKMSYNQALTDMGGST